MMRLALDTSTPATAVALRLLDGSLIEARDDPPAGERPGHTSRLLELAEQLLREGEAAWGDLGEIAVGLGPGTFTGLRVGVASARGLAQSLGVPLGGVSSLRALAQPALRRNRAVLAALDARRGEMFIAAYRCAGDGVEDDLAQLDAGLAEVDAGALAVTAGAQELLSPRAVRPQDIAAELAQLDLTDALVAVGDGALAFRSPLEAAGAEVPPEDSPLHLLRASAVCELADTAQDAESVEQVLPRYGRRPDAEIAILRGRQ